ncbi:hypothetical protein [Prosthecobacter dejongeii]|uniref:Uncharacterized protein n=1 Tax=Prosthecobacter dejongeii TaxID=48465 RepID=A0A7W7YK68_9BACT|nr:hypothetical protein [Prosthecobacter dejongeii]MBB5037708.1 hypothetical protein [Prosthecobacter dejongeii]
MNDSPPAMTDVQRVQAHIECLDALLAQGREAVEKLDAFYRENHLEPDIGKTILISDPRVPERHQIIFTKLLSEWEHLEERINEKALDLHQAARPSATVRAVGNRFRI